MGAGEWTAWLSGRVFGPTLRAFDNFRGHIDRCENNALSVKMAREYKGSPIPEVSNKICQVGTFI